MKETQALLDNIIKGIQEKKGENILSIDLSSLEGVAYQHFVICEANSTTQVTAVADSVREYVQKELSIKPFAYDGYQNAQWIVLDYGIILVHIFLKETRTYYNLESLWSDAKFKEYHD